MMNRRRVLQSFFSFTAGCAVVHCQSAFGGLSAPDVHFDNSSRSLSELLQSTIRLCDNGQPVGLAANQRESAETRQLCQQAIYRIQHSSQDTPAFWQACSDSVGRLEAAVSAHLHASAAESRVTTHTLHQLRSLKKQLALQVFQAIGTAGQLV